MTYKLGLEGKLYINTGSYGTPVWDEIPNVIDCDIALDKDEADMSNRSSGGWEMMLPTLKKGAVEFEMNYDPADADWVLLRDAYINNTLKEYAVADGAVATSGTQYLRLHAYVMKFGRSEKLREGMKTPVTLKPGYSSNANPAWVTTA